MRKAKYIALALMVISGTAIAGPLKSHSALDSMMRIYENPSVAPQVGVCKKNIQCNAFAALASKWQSIEDSYRYHGSDIKADARKGDGYGLNKGFSLQTDSSYQMQEAAYDVFYAGGSKSKKQEAIFAQGLAVLLYIEDKNGWAK